ncbi:MAG: 16S rRNA (cytidine(1402)-2'-O)-methyltransferase [Proteobacteria bacterium]|nr:16S rRNA (cytidine(1402)-2'-O)-methyltransferase [Pseudomonadota bacterium]
MSTHDGNAAAGRGPLDERGERGSGGAGGIAVALYVVATPLGHLRDITLRALDVLAAADDIYAEDTRVSAVLLARHGITTRARALHAHNEVARAADVIAALRAGRRVALVTDAGTPGISDPGARVVQAVRDAGLPVVPVPGPSAVATALSVAGLAAERFLFVGFLPAKAAARETEIGALAALPWALVFYEAPHRVRATVADLARLLGPTRVLVVARELTKAFEQIVALPLGDADAWFAADPHRERGEFVLVVDAPPAATAASDAARAEASAWLAALIEELPPARAAHVVARMTGAPRDALYREAMQRKKDRETP